jgi:3-oxoacyl-[acyl-carrier-protein] synthase III
MAIGILATGSYVPGRVVTNEEICALVPDATPDWILSRAGIVTRRYAAAGQATSGLAARAAERAVLVGPVPAPSGLGEIHLSSYGEARSLIGVAAGGSRLPASFSTVAAGQHFFTMQGRGVRDFVLDNIPPLVGKLLSRAGLRAADVGWSSVASVASVSSVSSVSGRLS